MTPKYPDITVVFHKEVKNGTALEAIGLVRDALKAHSVPLLERDKFFLEAISSNYQYVVKVCEQWVNFVSFATVSDKQKL